MTGCKTTPKTSVLLPPMPQRQPLDVPKTTKDYVYILEYYETLVEEWELWGATVTDLTKGTG